MAKTLFPDEAKSFIDEHEEGSYSLLDVRQPFEYEDAHLPGALLIPLPRLLDSTARLDPGKPVLVYCAVGGRSRMAAQLLANQGFSEVYHIEGGIDAWEAPTASGPVAFHLRFVHGDEAPVEVIRTAYRMEEGLRRFHQEVKERTADKDLGILLEKLVKAEESHKQTLLSLIEGITSEGERQSLNRELTEGDPGDIMEGGVDITEFLKQNERFLHSVSGYLEIAMMLETQALDLYLRMAGESKNESTNRVLLRISQEEKAHLMLLGRYMDERLAVSIAD